MVYMEFAPSTLLGLCLTIAGILLYIIRINKKQISRDYDLFFSSVGCLCGGILIFQGWRLDPILLLCQMMLGGTAIFFIAETIWLRNIDIRKEQIHLNIYENMFKKKNDVVINTNLNKKFIFNKSLNIHKNKSFEDVNIKAVQIDYTLPIDYF